MWYCRLSLCAIYLLKFWRLQQYIRYFCHWQFILVFAVHIAACNILALKAVCLCISATSLCSPASRCKCGSPCIHLVLKVLVCVVFGLFKFVLHHHIISLYKRTAHLHFVSLIILWDQSSIWTVSKQVVGRQPNKMCVKNVIG